MEYTSLKIIKKAVNVWVFQDNTMAGTEYKYANVYSDIVTEDVLTFTTKTGQILYSQIPYSIVTYTDETNPSNNFTPTSALALHTYLLNDGFFGSSSGGGGGATTLLGLTDALFANYFGRAGQALVVGDEENGFTSVAFQNIEKFTQLLDYLGGDLLPGKYIITSNITNEEGISQGLVQGDIEQIINTPIAYSVLRVIAKGYTWQDVSGTPTIIPNIEPFVQEIGDILSGIMYDADKEKVMYYPAMRWKGGSLADKNNFVIAQGWNLPFDTDPDYEA